MKEITTVAISLILFISLSSAHARGGSASGIEDNTVENHEEQLHPISSTSRWTDSLQADADWKELVELLDQRKAVDREAQDLAREKGYSAYVLAKEKHARKILAAAGYFWEKHQSDERRLKALNIYGQAHEWSILPWVSTSISAERAAMINDRYQLGSEYQQQAGAKGEMVTTAPPLFRLFPRDLVAEAEWRRKRNEMVKKELSRTSSLEAKEEVDWMLFTSDLGQASAGWKALPTSSESPDQLEQGIQEAEQTYWSLFAGRYWDALWMSFQAHIEKYATLPQIADRSLDFLGTLAGTRHCEALALSYWHGIAETYGDSQNPLSREAGIQALLAQAELQADAEKIAAGEKPLMLQFTALDGREIDLVRLRGKVVLIDFWATWCKPSIDNMPHLKDLYKKYHGSGLEIVGMLLDNGDLGDHVGQVVDQLGISWPQRYQGQGLNDPVARRYAINSLPTMWLLDKESKIVDINVQIDLLEPLIRKHIGLHETEIEPKQHKK